MLEFNLDEDVARALADLIRITRNAVMWTLATFVEGIRVAIRLIRLARRLPSFFAQTLPCPRGHAVPVFGVFTCACGALHEGSAFGRCRVCGHTAGWTPCPSCRLPVRNPLRF